MDDWNEKTQEVISKGELSKSRGYEHYSSESDLGIYDAKLEITANTENCGMKFKTMWCNLL